MSRHSFVLILRARHHLFYVVILVVIAIFSISIIVIIIIMIVFVFVVVMVMLMVVVMVFACWIFEFFLRVELVVFIVGFFALIVVQRVAYFLD